MDSALDGSCGGVISEGLTNNKVQLTKSGIGTLTLSGINIYLIDGSLATTAIIVEGTCIFGGTEIIGAISGIFEQLNGVAADLSQDAIFTIGAQLFKISYIGDVSTNSFIGGNDLVLQAVPEPSAWALLSAGLVFLMFIRRRRLS